MKLSRLRATHIRVTAVKSYPFTEHVFIHDVDHGENTS